MEMTLRHPLMPAGSRVLGGESAGVAPGAAPLGTRRRRQRHADPFRDDLLRVPRSGRPSRAEAARASRWPHHRDCGSRGPAATGALAYGPSARGAAAQPDRLAAMPISIYTIERRTRSRRTLRRSGFCPSRSNGRIPPAGARPPSPPVSMPIHLRGDAKAEEKCGCQARDPSDRADRSERVRPVAVEVREMDPCRRRVDWLERLAERR